MRLDNTMLPIVTRLPLTADSTHFTVHFGFRDPTAGRPGIGVRGVRNQALIGTYLGAFEQLHDTLTGPIFHRGALRVDDSGKLPAYVFHIADRFSADSPFMTCDLDGFPYIGLPCRSSDPTMQAAFHRAASEAVHEATHAFNWSARPYQGLPEQSWHWFDEATAVFMERYLLAGNPDAIRFCLNWTDMPERPLDHRAGMYEAGMFASYLAARFRPGLISDMWITSPRQESPFEALNRLMQTESPTFHSADLTLCPVFAEYCLDTYFLWDYASKGFALDVYIRFGKRALADCSAVSSGKHVVFENTVDHLACRYHRLELSTGVRALHFKATASCESATRLDIRAAVVTREMKRGPVARFAPALSPASAGEACLAAEFGGLEPGTIDHVLLLVANCGTRAAVPNPDIAHDDGRRFTIEVEAT